MGSVFLLLATTLTAGNGYFTSPECWSQPRYSHRPADAESIARVRIESVDQVLPLSGEASPNHGYQFRHEQSADAQLIRIDVEQGRQWLLRLRGAAWQPESRWINEKLLFVRVHWGRILASDLLIDVESGELLWHQLAEAGDIAYAQFQQGCQGQCPCQQQEAPGSDSAPAPIAGEPLLGLGEIAGVGEGSEGLAQPLLVRDQPDPQAATRSVSELSDFQTRELSYEQPALLVYAVSKGWLQVALADGGRVWVSADVVRMHPLEVALINRLNYLVSGWDGRVWTEPGAQLAATLASSEDNQTSVQVLGAKRHQGRSWMQIEVHSESPCSGSGTPEVIARGWVPLHQPSGEPLVWFYSRGC